jgi:hypothetical protein
VKAGYEVYPIEWLAAPLRRWWINWYFGNFRIFYRQGPRLTNALRLAAEAGQLFALKTIYRVL